MNRSLAFILCSLGLTVTTPAEAKKRKNTQPCWITSPCDPYLEAEYLVGVGSGSTLEQADAAAMGAIARQFVVHVSQTQTSVKDLSQTNRSSKTLSEIDHQRLRTETEVETNTALEQVKIIEHWERNSKNQPEIVYALAVVKRSDWLSRIDMKRSELGTAQSTLHMNIRKAETLYDRLPHYRALIPLVVQDVALYNQRQIIDPTQGSMPPALTIDQLETEFQQARQGTTIFIAQETPYRASLTNALSELDMPTTQQRSAVEIRCTAEQFVGKPDNYGFVKASTSLICSVLNNGIPLYEKEFAGKASSRDAAKAKLQSEQSLEAALKPLVEKVDTLWSL